MGRLARILSFVRVVRNKNNVSDVTGDMSSGENKTGEHFSSPGDDSKPLDADLVLFEKRIGTGRESAIGYIDTKNTPKSLVGEKRIYARDGNGDSVAEIWVKNTGDVLISNDNGSILLLADGSVNINGLIIDVNGNLEVNGVDVGTHIHSQVPDSDGSVEADTGVMHT